MSDLFRAWKRNALFCTGKAGGKGRGSKDGWTGSARAYHCNEAEGESDRREKSDLSGTCRDDRSAKIGGRGCGEKLSRGTC